MIAACEALMPHLFNLVAGGADRTGIIPSIIWMHRGSVPYISPRDFEGIYWATLKPIVQELWARGSQIVLYAEGNWDRHLEAFAELPEKSVIFHVDKTDLVRAHRVLGERFCLSGGIPNGLLAIRHPGSGASCLQMGDRHGGPGWRVHHGRQRVDHGRRSGRECAGDDRLHAGLRDLQPVRDRDAGGRAQARREAGGHGDAAGDAAAPAGDLRALVAAANRTASLSGRRRAGTAGLERVDGLGYGFCWVSLTW